MIKLCKDCIWFNEQQGEAKLTCQERTGVNEKSNACQDFKEYPFDLSIIKQNDKFLIKLRAVLKSKKFIIDKSLTEEINSYFVINTSAVEGGKRLRVIPLASYGPKEATKLISLFEKTQAYRDRSLSIKLGMLSTLNELKILEDVGKRYLYEKFYKNFQEMKTANMRDTSLNVLLEPLNDKIKEISNILDISNLVYINLKDTYFMLKEIKDIACAFLTSTRMES